MEEIFTLQIEPGTAEGHYTAIVGGDYGQEAAEEFSIRGLSPLGSDYFARLADKFDFFVESAEGYGRKLFDTVISGKVREAFFSYLTRPYAKDENRFCLNLTSAPELENVFWESLYFNESFFANRVTFFRYIDNPHFKPSKSAFSFKDKPLRILAAISSPPELPRLGSERNSLNLQDSFGVLELQKLVELNFLENPTIESLTEKLMPDKDKNPYHILYFIGYHAFDPNNKTTRLLLAGASGQIDGLTSSELGKILYKSGVDLIAIDTRGIGNIPVDDSLAEFARSLIMNQAGALVIVNTHNKSSEFSRRFALGLENNLIFGKDDFFNSITRVEVNKDTKTAWLPPVLYMAKATTGEEATDYELTLGGELPDIKLRHSGSLPPKEAKKDFYFDLEGERARGDAVEFGTLVHLVFDYDVPPDLSAALLRGGLPEKARQENLQLGLTIVPVGFSFEDQPESSNSRVVEFENGEIIKKARFKFRAASREVFEGIRKNQNPHNKFAPTESGFYIIFNIKGLTVEQFFLPIRLVDSIEADIETQTAYVPQMFDLDELYEFSNMVEKSKEKMKKSIDEVLSHKGAIS
jgi:hypothetical protein